MPFGYPSNRGYRPGKIPGTGVDAGPTPGGVDLPPGFAEPRAFKPDNRSGNPNSAPMPKPSQAPRPAPYGRFESGLPRSSPPSWWTPPKAPQLPAIYKPPGLPQIYLPPIGRPASALARALRKGTTPGRILDAIDLGLMLYQAGAQGGGGAPLPAGAALCCGSTGAVACEHGADFCSQTGAQCAIVGQDCQALPCAPGVQGTSISNPSGIYYMDPDPNCPFQPRYIFKGTAVFGGVYPGLRYIPSPADAPSAPPVYLPTPFPPFPKWYPGADPLVKRPLEPAPNPSPVPFPVIPTLPGTSPDRSVREWPTRGPQADPTPRPRQRPRVRGRTRLEPGEGVEFIPPSPKPPVKVPPAERVPPGKGQKERKVTPLWKGVPGLLRLVSAATEAADLVSCLYSGLPRSVQTADWRASGKRKPAFRRKLASLYRHWDKMNIARAVEKCAMQQLSDAAWARLGKAARQLPGQQYAGRIGWQGRISRPLEFGSNFEI